MTPAEIVIAACLLAGPLFVGNLIGRIVSALYEARNDFLGRCESELINRFYIDSDYVIAHRQWIMRLFWTTVGAAVGGFASGVFVQRVLDLLSYLS